jgi:hypothetical protein
VSEGFVQASQSQPDRREVEDLVENEISVRRALTKPQARPIAQVQVEEAEDSDSAICRPSISYAKPAATPKQETNSPRKVS